MVEKVLQINNKEKYAFWTLIGILFLCAGFYIYFVNATIRNVVVRGNLENKSAQLTLAIGRKEFQYINMRSTITLPMAYSLGFKDVATKTFISKKSVSYVSYAQKEI